MKPVPLLEFLDAGKTPWHVVDALEKRLINEDFTELSLSSSFSLEPAGRYFIKMGGTLIAFKLPQNTPENILFAAAHTDSPTLKLKPKPTSWKGSQTFLAVEIYGSPILSSYLSRDLAIAGLVYFENDEGALESLLVDLPEFPVIIPQAPIHFDKEGTSFNPETHLQPLLQRIDGETFDLLKLIETKLSIPFIVSHDLLLYPLEKARVLGVGHDIFASARIDNLGSTFALLEGFSQSKDADNSIQMALFWNHEEVGSETCEGAASPLFLELIERIQIALNLEKDWLLKVRHRSFGLSIDQAHATNSCFPEKHDLRHEITLGGGIVIKSNAKKRYSTNGELIGHVKLLCNKHNIPFQEFINRNDVPCGSTIGPVLSTESGFNMIDIGCPQLSMHSAREIASLKDHDSMIRLVREYFLS